MQNMRVKLTLHPESEAGIDLRWLMSYLKFVKTEDLMSRFIATFNALYETYEGFLNERTYSSNPSSKRKWFYTHKNVRSAYRQIASLIEQDQLFAYITHPGLNLPTTTNKLEGGINARISELLRAHRGTTFESQQLLISEFLLSKSER
ncbi:hypothetical protein FACS189431_2970 [Alphaproteobacteria bacterium]|nr:hypothetical protein FACS189431_2970 [Alphaproteobacteria bacterium]